MTSGSLFSSGQNDLFQPLWPDPLKLVYLLQIPLWSIWRKHQRGLSIFLAKCVLSTHLVSEAYGSLFNQQLRMAFMWAPVRGFIQELIAAQDLPKVWSRHLLSQTGRLSGIYTSPSSRLYTKPAHQKAMDLVWPLLLFKHFLEMLWAAIFLFLSEECNTWPIHLWEKSSLL